CASVGARTASSVAPSTTLGPPAWAAGANASATSRTDSSRRRVPHMANGYGSRDGGAPRRTAQTAPGEARRLPLPRRQGRRALHREGEDAARPRALVLPVLARQP